MNRNCPVCGVDFVTWWERGNSTVPISREAVEEGRVGVLHFCSKTCRARYIESEELNTSNDNIVL